jgi:ABC-type multidrug transport system ATPase subunit
LATLKLEAVDAGLTLGGRQILDQITLHVQTGQWLSIVGANEAGKTSLLHLLAGWRAPTRGHVTLDDQALINDDRVRIVLAPGPDDLPGHLLGREVIEIVRHERARRLPKDWDEIVASLNGDRWMARPVNELSLGTRRKVALASALCASPDVLLLDEAFDALDAVSSVRIRAMVRTLVKAGQLGVISASHAWESVFVDSDRIAFLEAGKVVRQLDHSQFQDIAAQSEKIQATILSAFSQGKNG